MRDLDPAVKTALAGPHYRFLMFYLGGPSQWYLTTSPVDVNHGGNVYQANGLLQKGNPIKETGDLKSAEARFEFADYDRAFTNALLGEGFINRWVSAQYAIYDQDCNFAGTLPFFAGTVSDISQGSLDNKDQAPLQMTCAWLWNIGETPAGRNCTAGSQKAFFPNDRGFEFVNDINRELPWGRE